MELFLIQDKRSSDDGFNNCRGSEGRRELFLGEYRSEIMRVNSGVGAISLFRVDVPSSS